jgi:hypothetical protein
LICGLIFEEMLKMGWETGIENAPKLEYNNLQSVGTL